VVVVLRITVAPLAQAVLAVVAMQAQMQRERLVLLTPAAVAVVQALLLLRF
jgi:hypothetical protein